VSAPRPTCRSHGLVLVVVALGVGLRFLRLDADPHYYDWIGYITDEGRWIDQARELALFGRSDEARPSLHVLVGPLFQALSYGVFRVLDVSILSSRLISAVSGSLLLVAFWLGMRRRASAQALLVPMTMLAFAEDLVVFSRIAIPEMTVMAVHLLIYLVITSRRRQSFSLALAGAAALVTVGIKITALPVVGIFALLLLTEPRDPSWPRSRWRDLTLFLAGLLSPLAIVAALWAARGPAGVGLLPRAVALVERFVAPSSLYGALAFVFEDPMAPALNLWLLALWCALVGWRAAGPLVDVVSRRALVTSVTWIAVYAVVMLGLNYFPNRYKIHILVPMAIAIAVGLTLLQRAGRPRVDALLAGETGGRAALMAGVLGLPTAVVIAPLVAGTVGLLGGNPERLLMKMGCTLFAVVVTGVALVLLRRRRPSAVFLLVFPVTTALIWSTAQRIGLHDTPFWATAPLAPHAAGWLAMLLVSGVVAGMTTASRRGAPGATLVLAARVWAVWYVAVCLPALVPTYLKPHYSIRSVSRQLAISLADVAEPIGSSGADGLFREGRLRYRTVWGRTWPAARPRVMVIAFNFRDPDGILERDYCLADVLPLYVSPMYFRTHEGLVPTSALGESVRIYRRRGADGCRG
jgi:hypothetical protein